MSIDRTDPQAPSQQIAGHLRQAIRAGEIPPGGKLPSERTIIEQYGVAPQTARQAIAQLKAEGLVEGQAGRGVFVRQPQDIVQVGSIRSEAAPEAREEVLEQDTGPAPDWVAKWLGIKPGAKVSVRRRRMWVDNQPTQLVDTYYSLRQHSHPVIRYRDEIVSRMPTPEEVRSLQLARGVTVVQLHQVAYATDGPLEVSQSILAGDRHVFAYEFEAPD